MKDLLAIDFEASCLPRDGRSFPIEVGIARGGDHSRSWLIRPDPGWTGWCWTEEAERLHRIGYAQLMAHGLPAHIVFEELMAAIDGRQLVSDSYLDQYWFDTLASAAGSVVSPRIGHAALLVEQWAASPDRIAAAYGFTDRAQPLRHRAGPDARWLSIFLEQLAPETQAPALLFGAELDCAQAA